MRPALYFLFIIILSAGCSKENPFHSASVKTNFSIQTSEFAICPTKAGISVDENSVVNMWILQFDGIYDDSKLIRAEYKSAITDLSNLPVILNSGIGQRVIFLANTFEPTLFDETNAPLNIYQYSQFKSKTFALPDEPGMFTGSTGKYLRMYGLYEGDIPNKSSAVLLYRIGSRININYISEDVSTVTDGVRFRITSLQLKNVPSSSKFISDPFNSTVSSPSSVNNYMITTGTKVGTAGEAYSIGEYSGYATYYIPENISGVNNSVISQILKAQYAPEKATYLEVKGEGIGVDGRLNEYVTFKFYLGNNLTTSYNINDNTTYNFNIKFKGVNISDLRLEVTRVSDIEIFEEEEIEW